MLQGEAELFRVDRRTDRHEAHSHFPHFCESAQQVKPCLTKEVYVCITKNVRRILTHHSDQNLNAPLRLES